MTDPRRVASAEQHPGVGLTAAAPTEAESPEEAPADIEPTPVEPAPIDEQIDDPTTEDHADTETAAQSGVPDGAVDPTKDDDDPGASAREESPAENGEPEPGRDAGSGGGWWGPVKAQLAELGAKAAAMNEPAPDTQVDPGDEFNLWSELGVYEPSPEEAAARDYDPKRQQALYWLIGGVGFVVIVSILFTLGLFSSERRLYRSVTSPSPTAIETPQVTETPESSDEPTVEPTEEPSVTPTPAALKTPGGMVEGTKQCAEGLWSGPQTSCNLATAAADQVDRRITTPVEIQAFSSTTNRNYRLQCTPGEGITCVGLDGVNGVVIYIAAP